MGRKLALLIGVSEYQDAKLRRLKKPHADVASLSAALRDERIGAFDNVETSIDEPFATVLRRIARRFADTDHEDLLLLYYAGHGVKDEQGQLHLATTDTDSTILTATAVGADHLTSVMNRSRSRKQLLILDCCFSGAMTGIRASPNVDATSTFADASGRIIFSATDSFQYSWEDDTALSPVNSVFTHHLVEGLTTGKADRDQDGVVTVDEWYSYVYESVRATTPKQTPQRSVSRGTGTFPIAKNPFVRIPLPSEVTVPMQSVLPSVREAAVYELARLLTDVRLAESARDALGQLVHDRDSRVRNIAAQALAGEDPAATPLVFSPAAPSASEKKPVLPPPVQPEPLPPPATRIPAQEQPRIGNRWTQPIRRPVTAVVISGLLVLLFVIVYSTFPSQKPNRLPLDMAATTAAEDNSATGGTKSPGAMPTATSPTTTQTVVPEPAETVPYDKLVAELHTTAGEIDIRFFPSVAPNHVKNFVDLAKRGLYNGTKFHRVIPEFMIQGGDPNTIAGPPETWGTGGSGKNVSQEFNDVPHLRGIVSMARANDRDSASSQFFICVADSHFLDTQYTVFGQVTKGMDVADRIANAARNANDRPLNPVTIEKVAFHTQQFAKGPPRG